MLSNVGHTIQRLVNNIPVAITTNDTTTAVATSGGNVYQTGLINGRIQHSFREILPNENIVGKIIDVKATENTLYLLNLTGSVFEYDYNSGDCSPLIREVYSPAACGGDKAIKIDTGRAHVLILTQNNKVWGAGSNDQYQLVPQGQCKYDTAVEIIITDTNLHDNNCCTAFTGVYNELECPVIPTEEPKCNNISCVKETLCDVLLGYLNIRDVVVTAPGVSGTLSVPVFGDVSYVGFLCVDKKGCVSGSLTYRITKIYIRCGCGIAKFSYTDQCGCQIHEINLSSTTEIVLFRADPCPPSKNDLCAQGAIPITGTAQINGKCGSCATVDVELPLSFQVPTVAFDAQCNTIVLDYQGVRSSLTVLCDGAFTALSPEYFVSANLDFDVALDCCEPYRPPRPEIVLPQPCWNNIYAGFDTSVLVDSCNRLYALGSLHNVRSNKDLLRRSCLEDILGKANTSVSFPADQLNCNNRAVKNNNCKCQKCRDKEFKTDLTKFGVHISFPQNNDQEECESKSYNLCDFLQSIKRCNEGEACEPTCEPCDGYIYLNIFGQCGCACGAQPAPHIGSITLFNKRSVCKLVSQGYPDILTVPVTLNSEVEFDLNRYCIDANDVSLDKLVKLDFCVNGPNVNLYIDLDQPGGIKFISDAKKTNVEFTVSASTQTHQFLLNFGSILDPVELTNLKYALSLDCYYPCARFKNPFDTKITNTYLKGGDRVRFVITNPQTIRQAITADVPTVFRLHRRVLQVAVGYNNLSVLVGGLACPNEVFVIGLNCHGELGLGTNESIVCWKQINRCQFDCQVTSLFAGKYVTFYITQSQRVYATGQWKCFVNSKTPEVVKSICQSWKIRDIAISKNQIILLGADGCIFGLGDNSLGELGLCHLECVLKPTPLVFFYKLNSSAAKQLCEGLAHPVEKGYKNKGYGAPCGPGGQYGPQYGPQYNQGPVDEDCVRYAKNPKCGPKKYCANSRCGARPGKY